ASVIGRIFALSALMAIHPIDADKPALPGYMEALTKLSLTLVESEAPDLAYIFKHAVTQEVAYNLMLFSQRRQLHQAIAQWIEQSHPDNLESYYALLAHHWVQAAEMPETSQNEFAVARAVDYLDKSGEQALQNYANTEAIQFLSQALEWDARLPKTSGKDAARERDIRRARWHSRIGLAHYGLGSLPDCDKHVREALKLLESPIPNSMPQFALGLFPQIVRQGFHRFFPSRYVDTAKGQDRDVALEVAHLYELMSRIYFYSNESLPIIYVGLRFLNEAEKAGTSPELAIAYSSMAVLAGLMGLHNLAETYVERGIAVANRVNQPSNLITVNVVTCVYQITVGKWDEVRARGTEAKTICENLGDYRQWGDSTVLLAESALISGDIHFALRIQNNLLEEARRRHNPLHQMWALFGVSANKIRLGHEAEVIPLLEEALQLLDELPNFASSVNTNGQLALAYHRLGDNEKALAFADRVLELAENVSPTVYSLDIGFAAVSEVYFESWENFLKNPDIKRNPERYKQLVERSLKLLRAFKNRCPIGGPYLAYYQGWYDWLLGKPRAAIKSWRKGIDDARKYNLRYEEGLLCGKMGAVLKDNPTERRAYLERAIHIFEEMSAPRELKLVRGLQETES
ncbi:MAG TPA: hypothetical protein VJ987_02695, partial [Anaerolineales bacterium]|nr:hypothetical protein [Anaerolineales bacterium]